MEVTFLTPVAAGFALTAVLPLVVALERRRRAAHVRRALGLAEPSRPAVMSTTAAVALVPLLLGLAAAQPVVERTETRRERTDAEALLLLDTSRSMLASESRSSATRLERARNAALSFRSSLGSVPVGLASFSERVLPHAFPTTDARVVAATLDDSMGIERPRPVPSDSFARNATTLAALAAVPRANYFAPTARKRLLVVLTDGETESVPGSVARAFARRPRIETIFVRFWNGRERVYATGAAEPGYVPDPASRTRLAEAAALVGGRFFAEGALDAAVAAAQRSLGSGPTRTRRIEGDRVALMPHVTLAAFVPLAFLLLRRNL